MILHIISQKAEIGTWCTIWLHTHIFLTHMTSAKYLNSSWCITLTCTVMIPDNYLKLNTVRSMLDKILYAADSSDLLWLLPQSLSSLFSHVHTLNRLLLQLMQLFLTQKRILNLWISECNVFPHQWINSGRNCSIPGNLYLSDFLMVISTSKEHMARLYIFQPI
jgi:hypothetical protein